MRALASVRRPAVSPERTLGALVAAAGAAFLVRAIAGLASQAIYPALFPPTRAHPEWLTVRFVPDLLAEIAAGMVAARAGGAAGVAAYLALELLVIAVGVPARSFLCARAGGQAPFPCDFTGMVAAQWAVWLGITVGLVVSRALATAPDGRNTLLRAAGVFALVVTAVTHLVTLLYGLAGGVPGQAEVVWMYVASQVGAAVAAGALLKRSLFPAALLLAICVTAPALANSVPLARSTIALTPAARQTTELRVQLWASIVVPLAAGAAVLAARSVRREFDL